MVTPKETRFKRRQNVNGFRYREGPSSHADQQVLSGINVVDGAPSGLNEFIPVDIDKVDHVSELAGSEVLLVYFAKLAKSHQDTMVDLEYIDTLIKSGARVNYTDTHGQNVMHEVSLRWPIEVAEFFLQKGIDLNKGDKFGRSPLHSAASVNYSQMVQWLIENGANVHCRTTKENQTPIHYAAKYNAAEAMLVLIENGARLDDRDHKERTPLHLAAEASREDACRLLMEYGAPAGVYDDTGTSCLTHMIEKIPDVAAEALEQFHKIDKASRTVYYYLSYLESCKWKMIRSKTRGAMRVLKKREPLEAIIRNSETRLIMHPVIQRLLAKKTELYGQRNFLTNLFINFLFTAIWTVLTVTLPGPDKTESGKLVSFYHPLNEMAWRIVLEALGLMLALYFVFKTKIESSILKRDIESYKEGRVQEIKRDMIFCHPRWPLETKFIKEEIEKVTQQSQQSIYDVWFWFDVLTFIGLLIIMITRIILVATDYENQIYKDTLKLHYHVYPFVLIIIWLRFMQAFRPFITLGPFIAMLGYVASDTFKFAFLFCEFYIPYCCAVWIVFGSSETKTSFSNFNDVMFGILRLTVVDSFNYGELTAQNKLVAQLICGTYLALMSITCLNLYIALLSETFSRVFGNATATAYMLQGEALINVEKKLPKKFKKIIKQYIADNCSPEAVYGATEQGRDEDSDVRSIMSEMENLKRQCEVIKKMQKDILAPKITFMKNETTNIVTQQDELMEDIHAHLEQMAEDE